MEHAEVSIRKHNRIKSRKQKSGFFGAGDVTGSASAWVKNAKAAAHSTAAGACIETKQRSSRKQEQS